MRSFHGVLAASLSLLAACSGGGGGGGGGGNGAVRIDATDAPFVFDIVTEAQISVDRITIFHDDGDGGPIVLFEGAPMTLDLLALRDGVTQQLVQNDLPAGTYRQLRLHVTAARLVLTNGNVYTTDDGTIHLTSQDSSGFKVFVDPPIEVARGGSARVLLDFDMTQTFHPIPANDPLNANRYQMHPVIHVTNTGPAGGLQGTVTQDDGSGGTVPVESATVYVLPPGETDPSQSIASTATNAQGAYSFLALPPGTYDVLAVHADLQGGATGVVVTAGEVTVLDITLHPTTGGVHGTITQDDGMGGLMPVAGANVYVLPPGDTDPTHAVASATTAADGTYAMDGIQPGTYDVLAVQGALQATAAGVSVVAGSVLTVDLTIH